MQTFTKLLEELDLSKIPENEDNLDEGAFLNIFSGLSLFLSSLSIGGVKLSQMDSSHKQDIENISKTNFGNKLNSMSPQDIDSLYKDMEQKVDKKKDFLITVKKNTAKKSNSTDFRKAATAAKKLAIFNCRISNGDVFSTTGNKITIDSTGKAGKAEFDSTNKANSDIGDKVASGITSYIRKVFPNVAQLYLTKDLSGKDFSNDQKKIMADVINNAIKRTGKVNRGATEYKDYGGDVADIYANNAGPSTLTTAFKTLTSNDAFGVATTLGRFTYQKNADSSYTITDTYDFSKGASKTVTSDDLKDMNYLEKIVNVMKKDNATPYQAVRHIAYLENPDTSSKGKKITITLSSNMMAGKEGTKHKKSKDSFGDMATSKQSKPDKNKSATTTGSSPTPDVLKKVDTVSNTKSKDDDDNKSAKHGSHVAKPVYTVNADGKIVVKMKNGKPVIRVRENLTDLLLELVDETFVEV